MITPGIKKTEIRIGQILNIFIIYVGFRQNWRAAPPVGSKNGVSGETVKSIHFKTVLRNLQSIQFYSHIQSADIKKVIDFFIENDYRIESSEDRAT